MQNSRLFLTLMLFLVPGFHAGPLKGGRVKRVEAGPSSSQGQLQTSAAPKNETSRGNLTEADDADENEPTLGEIDSLVENLGMDVKDNEVDSEEQPVEAILEVEGDTENRLQSLTAHVDAIKSGGASMKEALKGLHAMVELVAAEKAAAAARLVAKENQVGNEKEKQAEDEQRIRESLEREAMLEKLLAAAGDELEVDISEARVAILAEEETQKKIVAEAEALMELEREKQEEIEREDLAKLLLVKQMEKQKEGEVDSMMALNVELAEELKRKHEITGVAEMEALRIKALDAKERISNNAAMAAMLALGFEGIGQDLAKAEVDVEILKQQLQTAMTQATRPPTVDRSHTGNTGNTGSIGSIALAPVTSATPPPMRNTTVKMIKVKFEFEVDPNQQKAE